MKINIPHLLLNLRQQLVERHDTPWAERVLFTLWSWIMRHPRLYEAVIPWRPWRRSRSSSRAGSQAAGAFTGWTQSRDFKAVAARSFRQRWQETLQHERPVAHGAPPAEGMAHE